MPTVLYEPVANESIERTAEMMVAIAQRRNTTVEATFNGVQLTVLPEHNAEEVIISYNIEFERQCKALRESTVEPTDYTWRSVSMAEALEWFVGKTITNRDYHDFVQRFNDTVSGVELSDGSVVVNISVWSPPLSELTPDPDSEPGEFWIGTRGA